MGLVHAAVCGGVAGVSWAKLDDRYDDHPKVRQAWREHPASVGLHVMAITHSARYETDGLVAAGWLRDVIPHWSQRKKVLAVLVAAGLFEPVGDGSYRVHDFLDYNPSRLSKAKRSTATREAALVRWGAERNAQRIEAPDALCMHGASEMQCPSRPDPTRTTARDSPKSCGRARAASRATPLDPLADLASQVASILQGAVDGLTTDEPCRAPSATDVLAALAAKPGEHQQALAAAWQARSIAQSQNRAPNIVSLFAQRLAKGAA